MVIANYGYQDGYGEFYITIDTDKCNGCDKCVEACPKDLFIMILDDYDEFKPMVKEEMCNELEHVCDAAACDYKCHKVCDQNAISHSW